MKRFTKDEQEPGSPAPDSSGAEESTNAWLGVIMITLAAMVCCVIAGAGESAIAFAILIHAELKGLEHDEG